MTVMRYLRAGIVAGALCGRAHATGTNPPPASSNSEAVRGTWVLQQVSDREELDRLARGDLGKALDTPGIRGFCLRVPWRAIDGGDALLDAGHALARTRGVGFSIRFMAGRHTPPLTIAA